ncbi:MAG: hypothetical protein E7311_04120 [Clostridiales bacterium]|nr:hypothetical protein [Clostridiales bacterium]
MKKAIDSINKNKLIVFGFWISLLYLIVLSVAFILFKHKTSVVELAFIFAIGCFVYVDITLTMEYLRTKKTLEAIKKIQSRYEYFQTYMEDNTMIIEIEKNEIEILKKDIELLKLQVKELKEDEKLIQYLVQM